MGPGHRPRRRTIVAVAAPAFEPVSERAIGGLVVFAAAVSALSGIALAFVYRPHQYGLLRAAHSGGAAVAVISAIAAHVIGRGGRIKPSRRTVVLVVGTVVVLGAAIATGTSIAWREGAAADRGMFLPGSARVVVSERVVSSRSVLVAFVIHTALGIGSFVLVAGRYVRLLWEGRRSGQ